MAYVAHSFKHTEEKLAVGEEKFELKKVKYYYMKGRIQGEREIGRKEDKKENKTRDECKWNRLIKAVGSSL